MLHSENLFFWETWCLFHSRHGKSLDSGGIHKIPRHVKREQWHKRIFSNTVLDALSFEYHLRNKSHDNLGGEKNPHSDTLSLSDINMWCSMHNLLFWCIHSQSGSRTTFEFLHFPEWLLTCPREMGFLCCTVLHIVHVGGWSEGNHRCIIHFWWRKEKCISTAVCNATSSHYKKDI